MEPCWPRLLTRVRPDVKVMTNYLLRDVPELCAPLHIRGSVSERQRRSRTTQDRHESPRARARRSTGCSQRWNAGHLSGGRSLAVAISSGSNHRSALERHCRASDSAHRSGRASGLFLRPEQRELSSLRDDSSAAANRFSAAGISCSKRDEPWKSAWAAKFPAMPSLASLTIGRPPTICAGALTCWRVAAAQKPRGPLPCVPKLSEKVQAAGCIRRTAGIAGGGIESACRTIAAWRRTEIWRSIWSKRTKRLECLQEVGRLREVTFRRAGEGTGKPRDLDRFDRYYWHVLLWHKPKQELVGGYRAGNTAEILAERGVSGLYTSTLFRYDPRLFEKIGPALELGRSFVRPEYQRQYAPLLLLWKGIARLLVTHPETPVLFGAVSISNDYNKTSREMIYRFFEARMREEESGGSIDPKMIEPGMIEPRRPFRPAWLRPWDCRAMCHALRDLEELSQPITDVETDGKGLPILLRQYAKIGGKLLGFNVDRKFSNVLDGLVMVDLRRTEITVLERFMGKDGAEKFRRYHGLQS